MEVNLLSYTTLTPYPCKESVIKNEKLYPGASCISADSKNKLKTMANDIDDSKLDELIVKDPELIPDDEIITKLMRYTGTSSEVELLHNQKIIKFLGHHVVLKELDRFKPIGSRNYLNGTQSDPMYKTILDWEKVFPFFKALPPSVQSKPYIINPVKNIHLKSIINKTSKVFGILLSIATIEETSGWHSVGLLIDARHDDISIEYFDSGSGPPPSAITEWMEREKNDLIDSGFLKKNKYNNVYTVLVNNKRIHQYDSTSCGMFTLIFMRRRIEGIPYQMFSHSKISTELALDMRRYIYSD